MKAEAWQRIYDLELPADEPFLLKFSKGSAMLMDKIWHVFSIAGKQKFRALKKGGVFV
jgi:hypothetical protein